MRIICYWLLVIVTIWATVGCTEKTPTSVEVVSKSDRVSSEGNIRLTVTYKVIDTGNEWWRKVSLTEYQETIVGSKTIVNMTESNRIDGVTNQFLFTCFCWVVLIFWTFIAVVKWLSGSSGSSGGASFDFDFFD